MAVLVAVVHTTNAEASVKRSFVNPVAGETFHVVQECKDTDGQFTLLQVTAPAETSVPFHHHTLYAEKIEVLEGTFYASINGETKSYGPGDKLVFESMTTHKWWTENEPAKILMQTDPCFDGFHESIEIYSKLPPEMLDSKGRPKDMWITAALYDIGGTIVHGGFTARIFLSIYRLMSRTEKGRRTKQDLAMKYLNHQTDGAIDRDNEGLPTEL